MIPLACRTKESTLAKSHDGSGIVSDQHHVRYLADHMIAARLLFRVPELRSQLTIRGHEANGIRDSVSSEFIDHTGLLHAERDDAVPCWGIEMPLSGRGDGFLHMNRQDTSVRNNDNIRRERRFALRQ